MCRALGRWKGPFCSLFSACNILIYLMQDIFLLVYNNWLKTYGLNVLIFYWSSNVSFNKNIMKRVGTRLYARPDEKEVNQTWCAPNLSWPIRDMCGHHISKIVWGESRMLLYFKKRYTAAFIGTSNILRVCLEYAFRNMGETVKIYIDESYLRSKHILDTSLAIYGNALTNCKLYNQASVNLASRC